MMTFPSKLSLSSPVFMPLEEQNQTPDSKRRITCSPIQLSVDADSFTMPLDDVLLKKVYAAYTRMNTDDWKAAVHTFSTSPAANCSEIIKTLFGEASSLRAFEMKNLINKDPKYAQIKVLFAEIHNLMTHSQ